MKQLLHAYADYGMGAPVAYERPRVATLRQAARLADSITLVFRRHESLAKEYKTSRLAGTPDERVNQLLAALP